MTLIIALILLGNMDASWGSYLGVCIAWAGHLIYHGDR